MEFPTGVVRVNSGSQSPDPVVLAGRAGHEKQSINHLQKISTYFLEIVRFSHGSQSWLYDIR